MMDDVSYNKIEPGLYLGDCEAAVNKIFLETFNITHILSVCPMSPDFPQSSQCKTLVIPVDDSFDADLISSFDQGIHFIREAQENGSCLVHCFAGISRSAAMVIAFLMKKYSISTNEALSAVEKKRPLIGPNPGFMRQLEMYESMNCKLNVLDPSYKLFRLQHLGRNAESIESHLDSVKNGIVSSQQYKCRVCSHYLFQQSNVIRHSPGKRVTWQETEGPTTCEISLFLEPLPWMTDIHQSKGKLYCPNCRSKIGRFSWNDEWCVCGARIYPGFMVSESRVDRKEEINLV